MKRLKSEVTVSALADHLRLSRAATLKAVREAGIVLTHVELHYSDERVRAPGAHRHWRHLTALEAERVISYVRARQGARAATPKPGPVLP